LNQSAAVQADPQERRAFERLLESALAPLMPIAIGYGMTSNDVARAARAVYVHEMEQRLTSERGHEISDARLAIVAGMTRGEVAHIRRGKPSADASRGVSADQLQRIGIVLTVWHTNPRFSGAYGVPIDLDLEPQDDSSRRSFPGLVEVACAEFPEKVTLDELIAHGVAEVVGGTLVRCKARAAMANMRSGKTNLLKQYGRFLQRASETVAHNFAMEEPGERYFDRLLTSDAPLSQRMRKTFHTRAVTATDSYLTELDSWLSKVAYEPNEPSDHRYGVGVFFFEELGDGTAPANDEGSIDPCEH